MIPSLLCFKCDYLFLDALLTPKEEGCYEDRPTSRNMIESAERMKLPIYRSYK